MNEMKTSRGRFAPRRPMGGLCDAHSLEEKRVSFKGIFGHQMGLLRFHQDYENERDSLGQIRRRSREGGA